MILAFITARNKTNGSRRYLIIDTEKRVYARNCARMIPEGIEIAVSDYKALIIELNNNGYTEKDYL